jgi:hypothetical protein
MNKQPQEQLPSDFQGRMDDFEFEIVSRASDEKEKTEDETKPK